jgi:ankyrin repeat protein
MIKSSKRLFLMIMIISSFSNLIGMEASEEKKINKTKIYQPKSLLKLAARVSVNSLSHTSLDVIDQELLRVPFEIKDEIIVTEVNRAGAITGSTRLHLAKTALEFENLLALGANPSAQNFFGQLPLMTLLMAKKMDIVKKIFKDTQNIDIYKTDHSGFNILGLLNLLTDKELDSELIALLKELKNKDVNTLIESRASHNPKPSFITSFFSKKEKPGISTPVNSFGETMLHLAINPSEVTTLLEAGADPNIISLLGEAPLHTIIRNGYSRIALELLKNPSIDYTIKSSTQRTFLDYAVALGKLKLIEYLKDKNEIIDNSVRYTDKNYLLTLRLAIESHNPEVFGLFTETIPTLNPLRKIYLVYYAAKPQLKHLIKEITRNINSLNFTGYTPLNACVDKEDLNAMNILLDMGIDPFRSNYDSSNILFYALKIQDPSLYQRLLELAGHLLLFNTNGLPIVNARGETHLICAAQHNGEAVKDLIDKWRCNINAQDAQGNTALIHSIQSDNKTAFYYLMQKGADVNLANNEGITPLMIASENRTLFNYITGLLEAGASKDIKDARGYNAYDRCPQDSIIYYDHLITAALRKKAQNEKNKY